VTFPRQDHLTAAKWGYILKQQVIGEVKTEASVERTEMYSDKGYTIEKPGFGMWKEDAVSSDAVEYVNRLRDADVRTLREVVEDLNSENGFRNMVMARCP
jgi:hypothetical protein